MLEFLFAFRELNLLENGIDRYPREVSSLMKMHLHLSFACVFEISLKIILLDNTVTYTNVNVIILIKVSRIFYLNTREYTEKLYILGIHTEKFMICISFLFLLCGR